MFALIHDLTLTRGIPNLWVVFIFLPQPSKNSGVYDEAKETNNLKDEGKNTGKSPKKPRRPVKRFWEMSEEDVYKLKRPEQLDYNLDILFVSLNCALYRTKEVNFTFPKTLRNKSRHETVIKRSNLVANPTESQPQRNRRQKILRTQKCLTSLCFSWWIFWTSFNLINPFIFVTRWPFPRIFNGPFCHEFNIASHCWCHDRIDTNLNEERKLRIFKRLKTGGLFSR